MDITYDEYIDYINHLFMQEFLDEDYSVGQADSTVDSLTIY